MKVTITELNSFPQKANPYHHDHFNMGQGLGANLEIMGILYSDKVIKGFIIVDKPSGKRIKINLEPTHRRFKVIRKKKHKRK